MRHVFITGASSGLGRELALQFAEKGAKIAILARRGNELKTLEALLQSRGATAYLYEGDVRDARFVEDSLQAFSLATGRLDIVIANAGRGEGKRKEALDVAVAKEVVSINLQGAINTLYPAACLMKAQKRGTLVGISSVAAYGALPGSLIYSPTKAAVKMLMKGLALELHDVGVTSVCLCPGFVRTPLTDQNTFSMPFMMEAEPAARKMKQAIIKGQSVFTFPKVYLFAAQLLRVAPKWLLRVISPKK